MPPFPPKLQQTIRHQRPLHQPRPLARVLPEQRQSSEGGEVVPEAQALVERHPRAEVHKDDMPLPYQPRQERRGRGREQGGKVALDEADGRSRRGVDAPSARRADAVPPESMERECQRIEEEPVAEGVLRVYAERLLVDLCLGEGVRRPVLGRGECPWRVRWVRVEYDGKAAGPADESGRGDEVERVVCRSGRVDASWPMAKGRVYEGDDGVLFRY